MPSRYRFGNGRNMRLSPYQIKDLRREIVRDAIHATVAVNSFAARLAFIVYANMRESRSPATIAHSATDADKNWERLIDRRRLG